MIVGWGSFSVRVNEWFHLRNALRVLKLGWAIMTSFAELRSQRKMYMKSGWISIRIEERGPAPCPHTRRWAAVRRERGHQSNCGCGHGNRSLSPGSDSALQPRLLIADSNAALHFRLRGPVGSTSTSPAWGVARGEGVRKSVHKAECNPRPISHSSFFSSQEQQQRRPRA